MNYRLLIISALIFIAAGVTRAQYYDTGEDPASLRWMQIKTGRFTLLYPESYGKEGSAFASELNNAIEKLSAFYTFRKLKFPVVIHNYTTFSNGYVAWAPKRMELYPTPEQNTIPLSFREQLAIHEMTHILQMNSLNKGFSRLMTGIAGEQFTGLISAYLPMWFLEGDAVLAESLFSLSGRGRAPYFRKQLDALTDTGNRLYSYDKMLHGSFRNFTPDEYQYGFQMVAWAASKHGHQIWSSMLDKTANYPFSAVPVNLSLMKSANLTKSKLYSETFDSLKVLWEKERALRKPADYSPLNPEKKREYINYYSPVVAGRDSIVAIKTSLFAPASFVLINTAASTEKRIHTPGNVYPYFLSGGGGKIAWVELQPDPRWDNRDYSVIKIMSLRTRHITQLSRNSRYLAAGLSPDGRFVAAAENTVDNKNSIIIIDAFNGKVVSSIPVPGNAYPQRPAWSAAGDKITVISLSDEGEGIMSLAPESGEWEILLEPSRNDLQSAFLRNDSLFYISSSSGVDNVYVRPSEGSEAMLTNSRYGAYDLAADGGIIWFSDYSAAGYNISRTGLKDNFQFPESSFFRDSFIINRLDTMKAGSISSGSQEYSPERYRKWLHPFRFHSWMPFYADIGEIQSDPLAVTPGITLLSQNTLSTVISSLGYEYSDGRHMLHTRLTMKGWIPVIETELDYGDYPAVYKLGNEVGDPSSISPSLRFTSSVSLPLTFSSGRFTQYLYGSISSVYRNSYIYLRETLKYDYGQTQVTARLYFSNYHKSAIRDIYPRWAQIVDFSSTSFPGDKKIYGPLNSVKTAFYFPGFLRNHGIRLRFEYDKQDPVRLLLYNRASFPRGYRNIISLDYRFFSADYVLPFLYPDLNIPGMLYIKRFRGGIFHDYASGTGNRYLDLNEFRDYNETFRSFGLELLSDFYVLRIPFMLSGGFQAAWKNLKESPAVELIFRIDIYGMKIGSSRQQKI